MTLAALQELERTSVAPSYARQPVEFVRGEGTRLWDDEGNEYLDFLCGIGVTSVGHCHPAVVAAVRDQVGRLMHVSNLFYTEPAMRLARRLSESSLGGKVYFCNSGAEAIEAALKLARKARPGRRRGRRPQRVPRAHVRRALGHAAGGQAGAVRAARARLPRDRRDARGDDGGRRRAHRGGAARADPGRERRARAVRRAARGRARGVRRARRGARLRRDPVRARPHRDAVGVRADRRGARRDHEREGARRRPADRRADHRPAVGRRVRPRRPRLDVRRRPGDRGGRAMRRSMCSATRRYSRACAVSARGSPPVWSACRMCAVCAVAG